MLGLLKSSPAGKETPIQRAFKLDTSQPATSENMAANNGSDTHHLDSAAIAKAAAANASALRGNSNNYQAALSPPIQGPSSVQASPPSNRKSSYQMRQNSSYQGHSHTGRSGMSGFRSNSHIESGDIVKQQYLSIRDKCQREHGAGSGHHVLDTSYEDLMDWIEDERLTRLPHRGSSWDRVLISAQHFADHENRLGHAIESFAPESGAASNLVFGQCLLLLERLGYENAGALETAFNLFYKIGLEISTLLRNADILMASQEIMENVSRAFSDMLSIVTDVAMVYHGASHNLNNSQQASAKIDIYSRFGHRMEAFRARVRLCVFEIWRFVLERSMEEPSQILMLQAWLAPQDTVLALLASDHVNLVGRAEEYTCTWLQPHLNRFFKGEDKCLLVQGKAGSGKTTLANWVEDRLQRPISRKEVSTLSFFFNSSVMALETPLAMLKTLLLQLLTQRTGDLDVFHFIMDAYIAAKTLSADKQEERLWAALESILESYDEEVETMAIIIDLDEIEAQKSHGKEVAQRLLKLVNKSSGIRLLLFSSPMELQHSTATTKISLNLDNTSDDFQTIIRNGLNKLPHFLEGRDEAAQEITVDRLMAASDGSLLHAFLAVRYLKLQKSPSAIDQAIETLVKSSKTVPDIVQKLVPAMSLGTDSKTLLSLLVAAERPLSRSELELLLQSQPQQGQPSESQINLDSLLRSIAPFAMAGEGLVTLRHRAIKDALVSMSDSPSLPLGLKERHKDILLRLLSCARTRMPSRDEQEPTLSFLDQEYVETRLSSDSILEYTIRYWPIHLRKSPSLYKPQGDLQLPKEFTASFPNSVTFSLLEAGCWRLQPLNEQIVELVTLAFRVRRATFGEHHPAVLQSSIICALLYEHVLFRPNEAVEWYVKASKIGQTVLGVQSDLVIHCCTTILRLSQSLTTNSRTTIMTYREQTMNLLITSYKQRYGEASQEVLQVYSTLVDMYKFIGEEQRATEISAKIQEIQAASHVHEKRHHGSSRGSKHLNITLKKRERSVVDSYEDFLFGYKEEKSEESLTLARVDEIMSMALKFVSEKQYARAEELYLELWLRLDDQCRASQVNEWHEKKIQVMLKQVELLHAQKRKEEATALLLSCWNEYSNHSVSTFESIILSLKEVGTWMQRLEMNAVALTVFQRCWSWYKSTHREQSSTFRQLEEQVAVTSKHIAKESSVTSTKSATESSETVMREVFESTFSSTEQREVSSSTIELSESLSSIYIKEERWSEAASILKQTIARSSFSSFLSGSFEKVDIKSSTTAQSINLVMKLAQCYTQTNRVEKAEHLYLSLYHLHRRSCGRLDDALVIKYTDLYVEFLKKHGLENQLISFYQELLVEYRSFYGHTNTKTISVLYALGDLCHKHVVTHGYFLDYYVEIVTNLNQGALVCHQEAFRALLIVADHYYQSQRFSESLSYFKSIIATFCKFGMDSKYFENINVVHEYVKKYYKVIEETKINVNEHLEILKEIRQACIKFCGEESVIAVNVTLTLAEVCQQSEAHRYEAISYYEHVMKHSKSVSKTVFERSQSTMRSLYVRQVTSSSSSATVTKETLEKATQMSYQRYLEVKKSQSVTSHATLTQLKELVTIYQKQSNTQAALTETRSLVVECLSKTTSSQDLIETGKQVAEIYASCGYTSHAHSLIRELKMQLIYKIASQSSGFDITAVNIHACFAFLASLEWSLRTNMSLTISSFMAELLAESMFYERFNSSVKSSAGMHIILMHTSRLRNMLFRLHRNKDFGVVETKLMNHFLSVEPSIARSCSKDSVRAFLNVLLSHLSTRSEQLTQDTMTSRAGHAAVRELRSLLHQHKFKEAIELARCTYLFLMAHEGLDDPTEISLGFQLCLLMSGRNCHVDAEGQVKEPQQQQDKQGRVLPSDQGLQKEMLSLSSQILGEVLEICKTHSISLARCQWAEVNDLISLLGELKDFSRLQWLLNTLWQSRDGQSTWGHDVMLALGTRLVQASFMRASNDGERKMAIRLAEDLAYNVRRVHGARHQRTLDIMSLLASLYTSTALYYQGLISGGDGKGAAAGTNGAADKVTSRATDMATLYFKKAVVVHEDILKLLLDSDGGDDDNSDAESVTSNSTTRRNGRSRVSSPTFLRKASSNAASGNGQLTPLTPLYTHREHRRPSITREQEVEAVKTHLRLLKIALQRLGTWARPASDYEKLTARAWQEFSTELPAAGVKEDQVLSNKWKLEGYGHGKTEGRADEGTFAQPMGWAIAV